MCWYGLNDSGVLRQVSSPSSILFFFFLATTYNTGLTLSLSGFEFVCSDVLMIQDGIGVKMP